MCLREELGKVMLITEERDTRAAKNLQNISSLQRGIEAEMNVMRYELVICNDLMFNL